MGIKIRALLFSTALAVMLSSFPYASHASGTIKALSEPAYPFDATGLTAHPGETAAEIVFRANQRDTRAMVLAVVGYSKGIGGFPKSMGLAYGWSQQLLDLGAVKAHYFSVLPLVMGGRGVPSGMYGAQIAICEAARDSYFAEPFKKAGIFDLYEYCGRLEEEKKKNPDWETSYRNQLKIIEISQSAQHQRLTMARQLTGRKITADDMEWLKDHDAGLDLPDEFVFLMATTHDIEKEAPDWDAGRLLRFMDVNLDPKPYNVEALLSASMAQKTPVDILDESSRQAIDGHFFKDPSKIKESIRLAHCGHRNAMRELAQRHAAYSPGYVQNDDLALYWTEQAAFAFDCESTLSLALDYLDKGMLQHAWAWAQYLIPDDGEGRVVDAKLLQQAKEVVAICEKRMSELEMKQALVIQKFQVYHGGFDFMDNLREMYKQGYCKGVELF